MENNNNEIITPLARIKAKLKLLTLIAKAKAEYDKNNYKGCKEACQEILDTEPNNISALRGMGCAMLASGNKEEALNYYNKALEVSNDKETDYALIGTVYYIYDELDEALTYFNRAIDLNDNYDFAYEGRNQAMLEKHLQITDFQDKLINNQFNN